MSESKPWKDTMLWAWADLAIAVYVQVREDKDIADVVCLGCGALEFVK